MCSIRRNPDGRVTLTYAAPGGASNAFNTSSVGINNYDNDEHGCEFIFFDSANRVSAFVPADVGAVEQAVSGGNNGQNNARRRRRAVGVNTTTATPTSTPTSFAIQNPTICLSFGKALVFGIEINPVNRSLSHYPRYRKNHLLNTNDEFDYGNFRQLHSLIQESNTSLTLFTHVFTQNGTFVFYDNAEPFRTMIVTVKERGVSCKNVTLAPTTDIVLGELGVGTRQVSGVVSVSRDIARPTSPMMPSCFCLTLNCWKQLLDSQM